MKELTLKMCRISEKRYDSVLKRLDKLTDSQVDALYSWLSAIKTGFYNKLKHTYHLLPNPETTWMMYKLHGMKNTREQGMMDAITTTLKLLWSQPYKPERIKKNEKATKPESTEKIAS